jgi:hypothetical protein
VQQRAAREKVEKQLIRSVQVCNNVAKGDMLLQKLNVNASVAETAIA